MKKKYEYEWEKMEAIAQEDISLAVGCFHGQQAVEKYMKAALSRKNIAFPFTHNLLKLHVLFTANGIKLLVSVESLEKLNPFAVKQRYDRPPEIHVTREEAQSIVNAVVNWYKAIA